MKPNLFNVLKSQALNSNRGVSVVLIQQSSSELQEEVYAPSGD